MRLFVPRSRALLPLLLLIAGCGHEPKPPHGSYRAEIAGQAGLLPFGLEVTEDGGKPVATIINGANRVRAEATRFENGTLTLDFPSYESSIEAKPTVDGGLTGTAHLYRRTGRLDLPLTATAGAGRPALSGQAPVPPPAPEAPLIAGRYEVRDRIGQGAMGQVLEAFDHRLRRLVALKLMAFPAGSDAAELRARFRLEAQAAARLRHPGIVAVHDEGEGRDFAWIAMELVIGETLRNALDRGPPGVAEALRLTGELLAALGHAHDRGIVHRDVKPANILLEAGMQAGLGEVRLADFGVALARGALGAGIDVPGEMLGTPSTMSPEQVRGEATDHRADIWATGVVLYEMLTGRKPFGGSMPGLFHAIQHHQPPWHELPPGLAVVLARALAKRAQDRFASAAEMGAAMGGAAPPRRRAADAPIPTRALTER